MIGRDCSFRAALGRVGVALIGAALVAACGYTPPTTPTPPPQPPPSPPPVVTAPVIQSLTVGTTRTEVDRDVGVTAVVQDAETAPSSLTYIWSANVGTFTGGGMAVNWRLPKGSAATPQDVRITVTVVEPYQVLENGQLVGREHRVVREAEPFRVHDSEAELSGMVRKFLIDLFGNISIGPDACLVDFSDGCQGKADERSDIVDIRANYRAIEEVRVDATYVTVSQNGLRADILAPCMFRARHNEGYVEASRGDCFLTAVYEQRRWWLCSSSYLNSVSIPTAGEAPAVRRPKGSPPEPRTFAFYFR